MGGVRKVIPPMGARLIKRAGHAEVGMTMIELLLAAAIGSILLVIGIPALFGYLNGRNLDLGGQQLVSDLRSSEDRVRTEHFMGRITFTTNTGTYSIDQWSPASGAVSDRCNLSLLSAGGGGTWNNVENDTLPSGVIVTLTPGINPIVWDCLGMPHDSSGNAAAVPQTIQFGNGMGNRIITIDMAGDVQCTNNGAPCGY
jgi:type II secretory pathway pseudopilin PulG